jgi:predicted aspartyl protease
MKSLADYLPPEFAVYVHPDWRKNEADYWAVRDKLLEQYQDQWIGFADGVVVASGKSAVRVLHGALDIASHAFVTCVGHEHEPDRIRRATFPYDTSVKEPLPRIEVEFRRVKGSPGLRLDRVIPDTGADASVLPWNDCKTLQLDPASGMMGILAGLGGKYQGSMIFKVWAHLDGKEYECRLHVDLSGNERILGRDVLNQLEILFRGPANEVVVNP